MTLPTELRQMLEDAKRARRDRPWFIRFWHAAAERADIAAATFAARERAPKGPAMLTDDLRHALRRLRGRPATAAASVAMLALAIGVTAAMFTVADHMLIHPAPFKDVAHLRQVWIGNDLRNTQLYVPAPMARSFRQSRGFSAVSYFVQSPGYVEGTNGLANAGGAFVSPGAFEMLGVRPILGRTFVAGEGRPGTDQGIIISERLWRTSFGADPAIVGKPVNVDGRPLTVIGVLPAFVRFPYESTEIWRPYDIDAPPADAVNRPIMAYARLAPGVPDADAARLTADVSLPFSQTPARHGIILRQLGAGFLDDYSRTAIGVLLAGVGLVFLVLSANAANLTLARANTRRQEFGVCSALGASRRRLVQQVFLENAVIGFAALGAGLAVAAGLVALARGFLPEAFLLRTLNPIDLDARAFGVAAGLGIVATMLAGVPPAWLGTRPNAADSIRLESRGSSESRLSRACSRALLVGEIALASALLVGAGVLLTSFVRLTRLDPGLRMDGVTTMYVTLPEFSFKDRGARIAFSERLQDNIRGLPGVNAVTLSFGLPPDGGGFGWGHLMADGVPLPGDGQSTLFNSSVTRDFFDVYGIRLLAGRTFESTDPPEAAIVSEQLASLLWPAQSPIGHTFKFTDEKTSHTVIGVAHEVRSVLDDPRQDLPEYYVRLQAPSSSQVMLGMRCDAACPSESVLRERVRETSAQAMLYKVQMLSSAYYEQFARPRAAAWLAASFAVVAMLAAAGGLFSLLTYAVSRRKREFGIRSAMGAQPVQLRRLILHDGLAMAGAGLAIGGVLTWMLNRTLEALAFGVTAASPAVWLSVGAVIVVVTLAACWRPALSAMRADPIALLREN